VTVATASVILFETIPPAIVGVLLLGDTTRRGMAGTAASGFVLALVSAIALARFGEAGGHEAQIRSRSQPQLQPALSHRPRHGERTQPVHMPGPDYQRVPASSPSRPSPAGERWLPTGRNTG
jgi:hypothetical protein